ncbi:MAG: hypothetical protein A6F72_07370 [Cycloclasticus sp. symbiont of Poecilosclerida sp. N]|nr:MAG: hypothetical protein A6F72_07370 [Cycloclasticus sp. symbiont of Poecilosclerida sp. N]
MLLKYFLISAFTFVLLHSAVLYAADEIDNENEVDWYSVEYIVFENNPPSNQALEPWTKKAFQMPEDALVLDPLSTAEAFSPLNIDQQQLHSVMRRLEKSSTYTPIAHGGWIQPLDKNSPLQTIQINRQAGAVQLEGTLTFHSGRYLHLDIDLQLSEVAQPTSPTEYLTTGVAQYSTIYRLKDTRRIRAGDSHYFDHPRFGILAIVEKIDTPQPAVSTTDLIEDQPSVNVVETPRSDQALMPLQEN